VLSPCLSPSQPPFHQAVFPLGPAPSAAPPPRSPSPKWFKATQVSGLAQGRAGRRAARASRPGPPRHNSPNDSHARASLLLPQVHTNLRAQIDRGISHLNSGPISIDGTFTFDGNGTLDASHLALLLSKTEGGCLLAMAARRAAGRPTNPPPPPGFAPAELAAHYAASTAAAAPPAHERGAHDDKSSVAAPLREVRYTTNK